MKVFISSTVYDLIDVRAELAEMLRSYGVSPVLSDDSCSDFEVLPNANSIETCLANVRQADAVLCILDRRYGKRLGQRGFEDVSATHLEYLEAREHDVPVYLFVRDRLEADFSTWRKNSMINSIKYPWMSESDHGLFELLKTHRDLAPEAKNWVTVFSNSVDLKESVRIKILPRFQPQLVMHAIAKNQFPCFDTSIAVHRSFRSNSSNELHVSVTIRNVSQVPAFNVRCRLGSVDNYTSIPIFVPEQFKFLEHRFTLEAGQDYLDEFYLVYESIMGIKVKEKYRLLGRANEERSDDAPMVSRIFHRGLPFEITFEEDNSN